MNKKILLIKKLIKKECDKGVIDNWFYSRHLLGVEKFAKILLKKLTKADKEVVMLGVWLHDLQRIRGLNGNHAKVGAVEAGKVMEKFGYQDEIIKKVKEAILTHQCCGNNKPKTLEGKILSSADAMAHYINDFHLLVWSTGKRNLEEARKWSLEKLDRDYNKKIQFDFARKMIKKRHDILKTIFTMK